MFAIALPVRWSRPRHPPMSWFGILRSVNAQPWNVGVLAAIAVLTIAYLALANENATAGYELRALEAESSALRDETRRLELATIEAQSLELLEERIANQGYTPVASLQFLGSDHTVARR